MSYTIYVALWIQWNAPKINGRTSCYFSFLGVISLEIMNNNWSLPWNSPFQFQTAFITQVSKEKKFLWAHIHIKFSNLLHLFPFFVTNTVSPIQRTTYPRRNPPQNAIWNKSKGNPKCKIQAKEKRTDEIEPFSIKIASERTIISRRTTR